MYDFDSILMPLSVTDGANRSFSFEHITLPVARKKGIGIIAMKVLGAGGLVNEKVAPVEACLNYTLSLPISTAIMGCRFVKEVDKDIQIAGKWKQMSEAQMSAVQKKYAGVDFAKLETWKVPPPPQRASAQRYYGD